MPLKLPNGDRAEIDRAKILDYLLSEAHPVGRFKAAFFFALGYDRSSWRQLRDDIRTLAAAGVAELDERTEYGEKYRVAGVVTSPSGRQAQLVTVWIVLHGNDVPRFITAFPGAEQ